MDVSDAWNRCESPTAQASSGPWPGNACCGHSAAAVYTLIETCKMNEVDPQAWLADVLAWLPDHPANKVADLLPWNWKANQQSKAAVAA